MTDVLCTGRPIGAEITKTVAELRPIGNIVG